MQTHGARDSPPLRAVRRYVAAVRHMRPATALVGPQKVRAKNRAGFGIRFPHKRLMARSEPKVEPLFPRHLARQWVRLAAPKHRLEDRPDRIAIVCRCE